MQRLLQVLFILFLFSLNVQAQEENKETVVPKEHKFRIFNPIDTTYISNNLYNLTFMLEHSTWYEHYQLNTYSDTHRQYLNFSPNLGTKVGVYFGWRWIFLGVNFDIENLFNKKDKGTKKTETSLNIYSNKFGVDLYYRKTGKDFKLRSHEGFDLPNSSALENMHFDGMSSNILGLHTYWIFNHEQFSYPAVYSQSTNQRKNAGSFIAGFNFSRHKISFDYEKLPPEIIEQLNPNLKFNHIQYSDYSLGFGYGYNWVFAKNWVTNLSILPSIGYKKSKIDENDFRDESWVKDINFNLITRAGITYNNAKYFVGASVVLNTYDYRRPPLSVTNSFGTLRIYAGFNFWKRKNK